MPFKVCQRTLRTLSVSRPLGHRSRSSRTVWSTNSKTRYSRFFLRNTSIRLTRFSWRSVLNDIWNAVKLYETGNKKIWSSWNKPLASPLDSIPLNTASDKTGIICNLRACLWLKNHAWAVKVSNQNLMQCVCTLALSTALSWTVVAYTNFHSTCMFITNTANAEHKTIKILNSSEPWVQS